MDVNLELKDREPLEALRPDLLNVAPLTDSTPLIGDGDAIRARWAQDGVLYFHDVIDTDLLAWAEQQYRQALANEGLIDLANEAPIWTGKKSNSWRPCDAIGTAVWHKIVKQPKLVDILTEIFEAEPKWVPVVAHRSGYPSEPLKEGQDIFFSQHQDAFYNEGMNATICWMPVRNIDMDTGSFALAPGTHHRGVMHIRELDTSTIPKGLIQKDEWRSAAYRVGDVVIFRDDTAHAALPNLSNEFRLSMDIRVVSANAPQPVVGTVEGVEGTTVTIRTDGDNKLVPVYVSDTTYIREMNPHPRFPTDEVGRMAYPGSRVLAMASEDGHCTVLRRFVY